MRAALVLILLCIWQDVCSIWWDLLSPTFGPCSGGRQVQQQVIIEFVSLTIYVSIYSSIDLYISGVKWFPELTVRNNMHYSGFPVLYLSLYEL